MRAFLILSIPLIVAVVLFYPRNTSRDWMVTSLEAIEYRDAAALENLMNSPAASEADFRAFIETLETEFWPVTRYEPTKPISRDVEVVAQVPMIEHGMESTKIWTAVIDGQGRKGIFTLYLTPNQKQILAMELIAESAPEEAPDQ